MDTLVKEDKDRRARIQVLKENIAKLDVQLAKPIEHESSEAIKADQAGLSFQLFPLPYLHEYRGHWRPRKLIARADSKIYVSAEKTMPEKPVSSKLKSRLRCKIAKSWMMSKYKS
jgi:hypothetical protein